MKKAIIIITTFILFVGCISYRLNTENDVKSFKVNNSAEKKVLVIVSSNSYKINTSVALAQPQGNEQIKSYKEYLSVTKKALRDSNLFRNSVVAFDFSNDYIYTSVSGGGCVGLVVGRSEDSYVKEYKKARNENNMLIRNNIASCDRVIYIKHKNTVEHSNNLMCVSIFTAFFFPYWATTSINCDAFILDKENVWNVVRGDSYRIDPKSIKVYHAEQKIRSIWNILLLPLTPFVDAQEVSIYQSTIQVLKQMHAQGAI